MLGQVTDIVNQMRCQSAKAKFRLKIVQLGKVHAGLTTVSVNQFVTEIEIFKLKSWPFLLSWFAVMVIAEKGRSNYNL